MRCSSIFTANLRALRDAWLCTLLAAVFVFFVPSHAHAQDIADDPQVHYAEGLRLLDRGDLESALNAFERTVLLDPRFAGAWLELAIVHFRLGDRETALQFIEHVERNFPLNDALRKDLQNAKAELNALIAPFQWLVELEAMVGRVRNANSGFSTQNFLLTPLGSDPVSVVADANQLARADNVATTRVTAYASQRLDADLMAEALVSARQKRFQKEHGFDLDDVGAMGVLTRATGIGQVYGAVSARYLDQSGTAIGNIYLAQMGVKRPLAGCLLDSRGEFERRSFRANGYYSSRTPWIAAVWLCEIGHQSALSFGGRLGWDRPDGDRPGGETQKAELRVAFNQRIGPVLGVDLSLMVGRYADQQGYSLLLENGANRVIRRGIARAGLTWRADAWGIPNMYVSAYIESIRDRSDIAISDLKDTQVMTGVRYQFSGQ